MNMFDRGRKDTSNDNVNQMVVGWKLNKEEGSWLKMCEKLQKISMLDEIQNKVRITVNAANLN